jgi:hypothetical protein
MFAYTSYNILLASRLCIVVDCINYMLLCPSYSGDSDTSSNILVVWLIHSSKKSLDIGTGHTYPSSCTSGSLRDASIIEMHLLHRPRTYPQVSLLSVLLPERPQFQIFASSGCAFFQSRALMMLYMLHTQGNSALRALDIGIILTQSAKVPEHPA